MNERLDNLLGGRATDLRSRLARFGLRSLEPIYRSITGYRNRCWDTRVDRIRRVAAPVISIGNLTTGGTGKTPLVRWMIQHLIDLGEQPAIVSRGYGSKNGEPNDEFHELKLYLPETVHIQNPDRIAAARESISEHRASVIVLDDGFQHRRIDRDLDVVLIDATCPFGYNHLLPRGLLREPVESLNRADLVIITRVDQVPRQTVAQIKHRVSDFVARDRIATVAFKPGDWVDRDGQRVAPGSFDPRGRLVGFCGIGNPQGIRHTLDELCPELLAFETFADHHDYQASDLKRLQAIARDHDATALICTIKDLVKVRTLPAGPVPVIALSITTHFESGQAVVEELAKQALTKHSLRHSIRDSGADH